MSAIKACPSTLVPSSNRFSPRLGLAYSPGWKDGLLSKLTGGPGKTSIRAGYGIYYSVIEGNTMAIDEPQPPYGLSYTSPGPPLFATPFMTAVQRLIHRQSVSADLSAAERFASASESERQLFAVRTHRRNDRASALEHLSVQRELFSSPSSGSSAATRAQRELCRLAGASSAAGLFGESRQSGAVPGAEPSERGAPGRPPADRSAKTPPTSPPPGQTIQGTRAGLGPAFSNDDYDASIGNSNYNALRSHAAAFQPRT